MGEKENGHVLVNKFHGIIYSKPLVIGKLGLFSGIYNDVLMHCEGPRVERSMWW